MKKTTTMVWIFVLLLLGSYHSLFAQPAEALPPVIKPLPPPSVQPTAPPSAVEMKAVDNTSSERKLTIEEMLATPIPDYKPTRAHYVIANTTVDFLRRFHYKAQPVTPAISSQWFKEYLRMLDSQHVMFLQSDIDEFISYETVLWMPDRRLVNVEFAFKVYKRSLERLRERTQFFVEELKKPQDFTVKEVLVIDRKDMPAPKDVQEQRDLWRRVLKNELLLDIMDEEADAEKIAAGKKKPPKEQKSKEEKLNDKAKMYARAYMRRCEMEAGEVLEFFLTSLCHVFDPHSNYMAPRTKEDFDIDMRLSLQGIGATLTTKDGYTTVVEVVPGGPADKDGRLKKDDRIIAVAQDGQEPVDVIEMPLNRVVSMIRGPKGTKVHLTVLEEGSRTGTVITIVRDEVKLTESEAKSELRKIPMEDGKEATVLIMHLPSFYCDFEGKYKRKPDYKSTTRDMLALLQKAEQDGSLDGIIMDLRSNGGGALDEAISLAGLFVEDGAVVQVRNANGTIEKRYDKQSEPHHYTQPLIVMVDRFSASASEIVAATLQDHKRALIVGDRITHGKGTVQNVFDLGRYISSRALPNINKKEFGSLKMTIAKFYRINGGSTQVEGVKSDIVFESVTDEMELGEERLPYVLPWDEIPAMRYNEYQEVEALLPALKAASEKRRAENVDFQTYHKEIELYGQFMKIKELPLDLEGRRAFRKKQEEADNILKQFRKQSTRKKSSKKVSKQDDDEEEEKPRTDFILDETVNIMADYIREKRK